MLSSILLAAACVKASTFGWNAEDATRALQAAIDSGARTVIVDRQASDWIVEPIYVRRSNVEIVFEDGVRVLAKKDCFKYVSSSLFQVNSARGQKALENVTLRGEGHVELRMRKGDYLDPDRYKPSEWRHAIYLGAVENAVVSNLTLASSGGDGVYIKGSRGVVLDSLVSLDHNRQGLSVIDVVGLRVRHSRFEQTYGASPMAGVDFEPNSPTNLLQDIEVEDCDFNGNESAGIIVALIAMNETSRPVSLHMKNCRAYGNRGSGFFVDLRGKKPRGTVTFENCAAVGNRLSPLRIVGVQPETIDLKFRHCLLDARGSNESVVNCNNIGLLNDCGGLTFEDVEAFRGKGALFDVRGADGVGLVASTGALDEHVEHGHIKRTTVAELMAQYPSQPERRQFTPVKVDWKNLTCAGKFEPMEKPDSTPTLRGRWTYAQYVPGPGDYKVTFRARELNRSAKTCTQAVRVYIAGAEKGQFDFKASGEVDYVIHHEGSEPAIWFFEGQSGFAAVTTIHSVWPGHGVLLNLNMGLFAAKNEHLYFFAEKGSVQADLGPQPGEPISARLLDPAGNKVDEKPYDENGQIVRGTVSSRGVWQLEIPRGREDASVRLGGTIVPVAAGDPRAVLVPAN